MLRKLFCIAFLLFCAFHLRASRPVVLNGGLEQEMLLYDYLDVFEDPGKGLTIKEISSPVFSNKFQVNKNSRAVNSNLGSAYWFRFIVKNEIGDAKDFLIEFYDHKTDRIQFFVPAAGTTNYTMHRGGDAYPFSDKYLKHKNIAFKFPKTTFGQVDTYFVRIESVIPVKVFPVIRTYEKFTNYSLNEYYFLGIFYGIIIAMIIYNFIIFLSIKDKSYLYYIFHIFSFGLFCMCQDGTSFQYIWPDHPEFNNRAFAIALFSMIIWALVYARSFLITRIYNHFFNKILIRTIQVRTAVFILGMTVFPTLLYTLWLDFIPLFICYLAGISALRRGFKPARYYVLGFSLLFLGFVFSIIDIFPGIPLAVYSANIGVVLEMMVLSIALSDRIKTFKVEKDEAQEEMILQLEAIQQLKIKANRELEDKVQERTRDLELANEEILRMMVLLNEENENLGVNIKELAQSRVMLKDVDFEEFSKIYPDEDTCYAFLSDLKWKSSYKCSKCDNEKYSAGRVAYSRRCTKCGFDESPIGNTIFSGIKFSVVKAFYMVFLFYSSKKKITSTELSRILVLRQKTCWGFLQKIIEAGNKKPNADSWIALILEEPVKEK